MSRVGQRVNYNTFQGGKTSDTNPLNPNVGGLRTLLNVDIEHNGKVGRRLGLEPEENFNLPFNANVSLDNTSAYLDGYTKEELLTLGIDEVQWKNVDNQPGLTFRVIRIGDLLYVYNESSNPLSAGLLQIIDISAYSTLEADDTIHTDFQADSAKGLLVCAGSNYNPFYVEHRFAEGTWTTGEIVLQERDLAGVDDDLDIEERPLNLSNEHRYNLLNQGWKQTGGGLNDQITAFKFGAGGAVGFGVYPSNADIAYFGKNPGGEPWVPGLISLATLGNSLAPRGHFILDTFNPTARTDVSGVPDLPERDVFDTRPKAIAFFAGRVWIASVQGVIYYSQLVKDKTDLGKCYQQQDPTAEDLGEILDTDGGTIPILDIGEVEALVPFGKALLIFGTNGVWSVNGGDTGFTANNQQLSNISRVRITSYRSVVQAESTVYFWAEEGIYQITLDPVGDPKVESISENVVQQDYSSIPASAKAYAKGEYDRINRRVIWIFNYNTIDGTDMPNRYTDGLVYSVNLNAFWDYHLSNEGYTDADDDYPIVTGFFPPAFRADGEREENVLVYGAGIFVADDSTAADNIPGFLTDTSSTITNATTYTTDRIVNLVYVDSYNRVVGMVRGSRELVYTDDGTNWQQLTADFFPAASGNEALPQYKPMAYSPVHNRLVAFCPTGPSYSDDGGVTWTNTDWTGDPDFYAFGYTYGSNVVWDSVNNRFIAFPNATDTANQTASNFGTVVSTDGIVWFGVAGTALTGSTSSVTYGTFISNGPNAGRIFCIRASSPSVFYSDNAGVTWATVTGSSGTASIIEYSPELQELLLITGTTARIIADGGNSVTSSSAVTGTTSFSGLKWSSLHQCYFVGLAVSGVAFSPDGINYTTILGNGGTTYSKYIDAYSIPDIVTIDDGSGGDENVTVGIPTRSFINPALQKLMKYELMIPDSNGIYRLTFGQMSSRNFHDWVGLTLDELEDNIYYTASFPVAPMDSGNYDSVVETLPQTLGEPTLNKQATYVYTYYDYRRGGFNETVTFDEFDPEEEA